MPGEFRHAQTLGGTPPGQVLARADWEGTEFHILNDQAAGDLIFADTDGRLRRLAAGPELSQLTVISGLPAWGAPAASSVLVTTTVNPSVETVTNPTVGTSVV